MTYFKKARSILLLLAAAVFLIGHRAEAYYDYVTPTLEEMQQICGDYVVPSATYRCNNLVNGTYSDCVDNPFSCTCDASAPPQFQTTPSLPCEFNYGVVPCAQNETELFCGPATVSCTKRCDVNGTCAVANTCACEPWVGRTTVSADPCTVKFQGDKCYEKSTTLNERQVTDCGVFAIGAFYMCPNTTLGADCRSGCTCRTGTGQVPTTNKACNGFERPCNSGDVQAACGQGYRNCTKSCLYDDSTPWRMSVCVVLQGSCVLSDPEPPLNSTAPRSCTTGETLALCGAATASCTTVNGQASTTTCVCTDTGFKSGNLPCQAWFSWVAAPASYCTDLCGSGYINMKRVPGSTCALRRFFTPQIPVILNSSPPPPSGYTDAELMAWWTYNNNMVQWNATSISWVDNMVQVRNMANQFNLTKAFYTTECVCDATFITAAQERLIAIELPSLYVPGELAAKLGASPLYATDSSIAPINQAAAPYVLKHRLYPSDTYIIYPGTVRNLLWGRSLLDDSFYSVDKCGGPSVKILQSVLEQTGAISNTNLGAVDPFGPTTNLYLLNSYKPPFTQFLAFTEQEYNPSVINTQLNRFDQMAGSLNPPNYYLSFPVGGNKSVVYQTQQSVYFPSQSMPDLWNFAFPSGLTTFLGCTTVRGQCDHYLFNSTVITDASDVFSQRPCHGLGVPIFTQSSVLGMTNGNLPVPAPYWRRLFTVTPVVNRDSGSPSPNNEYGPVALNNVYASSCTCFAGWTGRSCNYQSICTIETCGYLFSYFSPLLLAARSELVFVYDSVINKPPSLFKNCSYNDPFVPPTATPCNLALYSNVASQFCANGVPVYRQDGVYCVCNNGWTWLNNDARFACLQPDNCPFQNSTGIYPCGGHGSVSPDGGCICDNGYRLNITDECCISTACPAQCQSYISRGLSHIAYCDDNTLPAKYVCSTATNFGYWNGTCCEDFEPWAPCAGAYLINETVYKEVNVSGVVAVVPLVFNKTQNAVNPDAMYCRCESAQDNSRGNATGGLCDISTCPLINGLPCNGKSPCNNGRCYLPGALSCKDDANFFGCNCAWNITAGCRLENGFPLCQSEGLCKAGLQEKINYTCACRNQFGGKFCQTSPCGPGNCNFDNAGGVCRTPLNAAPYCDCYNNTDQSQDPCLTGVGCLWAGPTCSIDVTQTCGALELDARFASTCNDHGLCNVTNPSNISCSCTQGWITSENRCIQEPCVPPCGIHGKCLTAPDEDPTCDCDPLWDFNITNGCTINLCPFGIPKGDLCTCINPAYAYTTECPSVTPCTTLTCNSTNGVPCGQLNCAIMPSCRNYETETCNFGCTQPDLEPCGANVCRNGTCTCHWSSRYDPYIQACVSKCGAWPATKNIIPGPNGDAICECEPEYFQGSNCFDKFCVNGHYDNFTKDCDCEDGWGGPSGRCDVAICGEHGRYNNKTGQCDCDFPWAGGGCSLDTCLPGGVAFENTCQCLPVFGGATCKDNLCVSGSPNAQRTACNCIPGWNGQFCNFFGCAPPNVVVSPSQCDCTPNWFGSACQYSTCNAPAGNFYNGQCICGGVSIIRNGNCTGNLCGVFGEPETNLLSCLCERGTTNSVPDATHSYWCTPICLNGGVYNNDAVPIRCDCVNGYSGRFCETPPPVPTGSSTGGGGGTGGTGSATGGSTGATSHAQPSENSWLTLAITTFALSYAITVVLFF